MPNDLQKLLWMTRLNETYVLNLLQERGFISDHCLAAADVASADASHAVTRLMGRPLDAVSRWLEPNVGRMEDRG